VIFAAAGFSGAQGKNEIGVGGVEDVAAGEARSNRVSARAWFTLAILLLMMVLSFLDRGLIALMVKPIREAIGASDVEISLLYGLSFGLFYAVFSFPLAWLADRWSLRGVIYSCTTIWSFATAACGLAHSFWQLAVARFAVGFGEGGLSPSAYRILSESFPKRRLGLAAGIFGAGTTLASPVSLWVGGGLVDWTIRHEGVVLPLIGEARAWQLVFLILGPIGALLAPFIFLAHSGKGKSAPGPSSPEEPMDGLSFVAFLRSRWLYLTLVSLGFGANVLFAYGYAAWAPTYFQRHFGLSMSQIGAGLALVTGGAGSLGYIGGGWLTDRWFAHGVRDAHFRYFVYSLPGVIAAAVVAFALADRPSYAFAALACFLVLLPSTAPAAAHLQLATPTRFRGRLMALFIMVFSIIGMTAGPLVVALLTEHVFHDPARVGQSIATTVAVAGTLSFLLFLASLKPAREAIAAAQSSPRNP
jgi:MFS family permease